MTLNYDPIAPLESIGYLEREASFLYLVAVHSGYFLARQFCQFVNRERGALPTRFLEKASRLHHIRVVECGRGRHIYHLVSKPVYEALGRRNSQNRRIKGDAHIKSRLMVLDFLLANLRANVLEDSASKVDFFTAQCGVAKEVLPYNYVERPLYFSDGFPIHSNLNLITDKGTVYTFTLDEDESAEHDLKVVIEPSDPSSIAAANGADKLVSASEIVAAQQQARLAQTRAAAQAEQFRADYPVKALKFDYVAAAVCVLIGPVFIPWFIVPKMDWLFWGWFKAFTNPLGLVISYVHEDQAFGS